MIWCVSTVPKAPITTHAVPNMVALCTDDHVIIDFYVMDRIEGIIPRANLPKALTLSEQQVSELCRQVVDALIDLHKVDYTQNPDLVALGKRRRLLASARSWGGISATSKPAP